MSDGIARHPEYYGHQVNSQMRLPADTRKFRDIKIKEIPTWLMKRDWRPIGMFFSWKRLVRRNVSRHWLVQKPGANLLFIYAIWLGTFSYMAQYKQAKRERLRKYH